MPKRISKKQRDDAIYGLWFRYVSTFGMVEAKKIVYGAYKEIRRQHIELKAKYSKRRLKK